MERGIAAAFWMTIVGDILAAVGSVVSLPTWFEFIGVAAFLGGLVLVASLGARAARHRGGRCHGAFGQDSESPLGGSSPSSLEGATSL